MITLTVDRFKDTFFDREVVRRAADKAQFDSLRKGGGSIRLIARRSIRRRKKPSAPGQPPSSRKGQLKEFIFFGYDVSSRSVVVGPARLDRPTGAPNILEFSGTAKAPDRRRVRRIGDGGEMRISDSPIPGATVKRAYSGKGPYVAYARVRSARQAAHATRLNDQLYRPNPATVRIAARPYMAPALDTALPQLPRHWARSVNGG